MSRCGATEKKNPKKVIFSTCGDFLFKLMSHLILYVFKQLHIKNSSELKAI